MLDTMTLKSSIKSAMLNAAKQTDPQKQGDSVDALAGAIADAVAAFVKSGDVMPGIQVATTGSAAAQTGATTGTGKIQ
jgi:hypothetical protein